MDPRFDERDPGAGAQPEPEPEPDQDPEPGLEPDAWAAPEAWAEPAAGSVPRAVAPDEPDVSDEPDEPEPAADPDGASELSQAETVMLDTEADPEAETEAEPERRGSIPHRMRMAFRNWRRSRPFWGALLVNLGGLEILYSEKAPLKVVVHLGPLGVAGYLLPLIMLLCGLLLWFNPAQRTFYSILSVLLSLGTWITSNLGGFVIGLLLGVVGGSLAFGWRPFTEDEVEEREAKRRRKKALRARRKVARSRRASGAGGTRTAHSGRAVRAARPRRTESAGGAEPEVGKPTQA